MCWSIFCFFFFNDTATTEIYTLSLHDALPIYDCRVSGDFLQLLLCAAAPPRPRIPQGVARLSSERRAGISQASDRKSTRLNSSHANISYAVFCLKKKKNRG